MKRFIAVLFTLSLVALAAESWAGPLEEVAQIAAPRGKMFEEGSAEGYAAAFADNAVLTSSLSAYRIEGKDAIQAYFVQLFQLYPRASAVYTAASHAGLRRQPRNSERVQRAVRHRSRREGHATDAALERGLDQGRRPLADR